MPYIHLQTNTEISKEKEIEIKAELGKAIECFPGKTEDWLMINIEDNSRMWFKGKNDSPMAMITVKIFGKSEPENYEKMTKTLCDIMKKSLNVAPDKVYAQYDECDKWGWNNINF